MRKPIIKALAIFILLLIFLDFSFVYILSLTPVQTAILRVRHLSEEISCKSQGHLYISPVLNPLGNINTGCYVVIESDKDKQCMNSSDCRTRKCFITLGIEPDQEGKYTGKCEYMIHKTVYERGGVPGVTCGEAEIENGKITEDMRFCVY